MPFFILSRTKTAPFMARMGLSAQVFRPSRTPGFSPGVLHFIVLQARTLVRATEARSAEGVVESAESRRNHPRGGVFILQPSVSKILAEGFVLG